MHENNYLHNPTGQVTDIVTNTRPGQIVLAHDVGTSDRLLAHPPTRCHVSTGCGERGFRFVTVTELLALRKNIPGTTADRVRVGPMPEPQVCPATVRQFGSESDGPRGAAVRIRARGGPR